jgi:hypothetical protein
VKNGERHLSADDRLHDLLDRSAFAGFAELILPWDDRAYDKGMRLRELGSLLPYHSHVNPQVVRGKPGAPFAVIAPGGGFAFVASLHEGFPYAAEISRAG